MPSQSRLLELPAELRLAIYEYVFDTGQCGLLIAEGVYKDIVDSDTRDTALLYTCRSVHIEARAVLFDSTEFTIFFWDQATMPRHHRLLGPLCDANVLDNLRDVRLVGALGPSEDCEMVVKAVDRYMEKTDQCIKMRRVQLEFHVAPGNKDGQIDAIIGAFATLQAQKTVLVEMDGDGVDSYSGAACGSLQQKMAQ